MTFTYTGNPEASPTDEVRFLLQDIDPTDPLFSDEEITYYLTKLLGVSGSTLRAAANLAETAAAKYARQVTISSDATTISMEQLQQKFTDLAASLRAQAAELDISGVGGPIVGGSNRDDWFYGGRKTFRRRMNDNPRAGNQDLYCSPWDEYEYGGWWEGQ